MAGHWIEWEKGLVRKPEMFGIARALGVSILHAAAACMLVWEWADDNTANGQVKGICVQDLSAAVGVEGIGEAMQGVGWLIDLGDGVAFPNWERHNAEPAKRRALKAMYMRMYRAERKTRAVQKRNENVTGA